MRLLLVPACLVAAFVACDCPPGQKCEATGGGLGDPCETHSDCAQPFMCSVSGTCLEASDGGCPADGGLCR